jgi:hypothetical protein
MEIAQRRRAVSANLLAGATYTEIGRALNVSKATITSDKKAILEEWRAQYTQAADQLVALQLRRLDMLLNAIWEKALKGDNDKAIGRALDILDRQNAILGVNKTPLSETNVVVPIQIVEVNRLPAIHLTQSKREGEL